MAPSRSKPLPKVGSAQWILTEKEQILHLADQEVEEFTFSARNEMEWLNEHMAEVFDENQINIPELFKTPGKLRGKTPRTNRKRNALEARTPLTEVFATNQPLIQSPPYKAQNSKQVVQFQVAEDPIPDASTEQNDAAKLIQDGKAHTDSGYHGTSDEDMEVDRFLAECDREISLHKEAEAKDAAVHDADRESVPEKETQAVDDVPSPSDGSSPARALVRKSSLTFAALPAREPLANKKSIGGRNQRTSQSEQSKVTATNRESYYGMHTDGKSLGGLRQPQQAEEAVGDMDIDEQTTVTSEMIVDHPVVDAIQSDLHHKSSTQRLHDKISMLAQSQPTRPTKSIPPTTANTMHLDYPDLQRSEIETPLNTTAATTALNEAPESVVQEAVNDDRDDWIQPSPQVTPHAKRDIEFIDDGRPFSASRARLQAMLHNARGLFARSANASARAKLETIRDVDTTRVRVETTDDMDTVLARVETTDDVDMVDVPSTTTDCPTSMAPPPLPNLEQPPQLDPEQPPQLSKAKDIKRPTKPAKDAVPKPKPQPVSIRVGTLSQRVPLTNNALSSSLQDSLPAPGLSTISRQATVTRKPNAPSVPSSASSTTFKRSVSSVVTKPKALLVAERKKEQDEREAQRKLEQKREIERKRAAQQEEARRLEQEQRKEAERLREKARAAVAEDPKRIAQRQAIEQRRLDLNARKAELQQRNTARLGTDLGHALQQERAQPAAAHARGELGTTKPPSRMNSVQEFSRVAATQALANAAKTAKPAKRPAEDESSQRPGITRIGALSQEDDTKRRRTGDEDSYDPVIRPTMAPPIRQSNIRKDAPKLSAFPHSYNTAPAAANSAVAAPFLQKPTTNNQFHLYHQQQPQPQQSSKADHPMDMANRVTGKIPFAETPNPPFPAHRTPQLKQPLPQPATSSPNYEDDDITLPDINTDSEDDDGSDGETGSLKPKKKAFVPPDWANSPQLRELLEAQQLVDPASIFGPIKPPNLEKMFPNKERHHRFRQRTSSANWSGADRLTEEEIRRDFAAREKMSRQGGWSNDL